MCAYDIGGIYVFLFWNDMFEANIYKNVELCGDDMYPLFSLTQKPNTFYYYTTIQGQGQAQDQPKYEWRELSKDKLVWFLNIIHMKITKLFTEWKKIHKQEKNKRKQDEYPRNRLKSFGTQPVQYPRPNDEE